MTGAALPSAASRIRATPYARRLARERGLPLEKIAGSGPNGRIVALDLEGWQPAAAPEPLPPVEAAPAAPVAMPQQPVAPATAAVPSAIVAGVAFAEADALLARVAELRPGVLRADLCLKAAAAALQAAVPALPDAILLLAAPDGRQVLAGLARASLGAVASMRAGPAGSGEAALALSFVGRPGVRPVTARLADGIAARLVIGAAAADGTADCLLSYDPARLGDDAAEELLSSFRDLVETPLRLLV